EAERVLDENDGEDHDGLVVIMRARLAARRGEYVLAERLAREERGGWSHGTGVCYDQGEILLALAEVQARAGEHEDARTTLADAVAWSEAKEHLVFRERAARLLEEYGSPGPERRAPST
ncbi:MAG TPA: hypothetical protein VHP57_07635, partial [Acidimicrobiia bacterium]|nr:hypothetical protein [Acidimicrobiia bacterium]